MTPDTIRKIASCCFVAQRDPPSPIESRRAPSHPATVNHPRRGAYLSVAVALLARLALAENYRLPARPFVRERVTLVHVFVEGDRRGRRLPMVVYDRFALRARVDAAAPLGLLQRRTGCAASTRLYRDLPRPLGLAYPAAATARAPRTPFADLAISGCTWNHECNYSARKDSPWVHV